MKRVVLIILLVSAIAYSATGWYSDYVIISVNGGESSYYWIGDDPSFGTELNSHTFNGVLSLQITGADMRYWSDTQDRTGGAFYWKIMDATNTTQIKPPAEVIWTQSSLEGNDYQGLWSGSINVLSGLSGGVTYKLHIWAKHWGTGEGDNYLSNNTNNYVATFTTDASLPVTLSAFTAKAVKGTVVLEWETSAEIENQGFVISRKSKVESQKSEVIADFTTVDALKGQGTTTETTKYAYTDKSVEPGKTYVYTLADVDYAGNETVLEKVEVKVEAEGAMLTEGYALKTAYPNPFNPSVTLSYQVPAMETVTFLISDLTGRTIWSAQRAHTSAGTFELTWNGNDLKGAPAPSGLYILKMNAGEFRQAMKLTLVR